MSDSSSTPSILQDSGSELIPTDESESEPEAANEEEMDVEDPPAIVRTRKRKRNLNQKEQRKIKRNSGKAYTTGRGNRVPEKIFTNPPCGCRMKCSDNVTEEQRKKLFDDFYCMTSFQIQNAYICGLCKQCTPKVHHARDGSQGERSSFISYYLQLSDKNLRVCKQFFL